MIAITIVPTSGLTAAKIDGMNKTEAVITIERTTNNRRDINDDVVDL